LGIDLEPTGGDGPNSPQANFPEGSGPNRNQHFPENLRATGNATSTTITGNVPTGNPTAVTLEFFWNDGPDTSNFGEGKNFMGTRTPNADGSFTVTLPVGGLVGKWITATATRNLTGGNGETSEFSAAVPVGP
jgi:hypothetical protein